MTASAEVELNRRLASATLTRAAHVGAEEAAREATIAFMNEALYQGWSWSLIGDALGITSTAARRYHDRNKRHV